MLDRKWYKLVDALEEVTDFWTYGRDLTTMPTYNSYVPTQNNVVPRPDFDTKGDDDTKMRYNMSRVSPAYMHNPLKSKIIFLVHLTELNRL